MKEVIKDKDSRVLVFDRGEEVISTLRDYCTHNNIKAGWVSFIGGCNKVDLYYYDLDEKKYLPKEFEGNLEVLPCSGDISLFEDKTVVHVHGSFSNREYGVVGGHVNSLTVSLTIEAHLRIFQGEIHRKHDEFTGLNLMCPI